MREAPHEQRTPGTIKTKKKREKMKIRVKNGIGYGEVLIFSKIVRGTKQQNPKNKKKGKCLPSRNDIQKTKNTLRNPNKDTGPNFGGRRRVGSVPSTTFFFNTLLFYFGSEFRTEEINKEGASRNQYP